jgi:hypothetical protein
MEICYRLVLNRTTAVGRDVSRWPGHDVLNSALQNLLIAVGRPLPLLSSDEVAGGFGLGCSATQPTTARYEFADRNVLRGFDSVREVIGRVPALGAEPIVGHSLSIPAKRTIYTHSAVCSGVNQVGSPMVLAGLVASGLCRSLG